MTVVPGYAADLFRDAQIVLTGAAGGIGTAIDAAFTAYGARVIRIDRPEALPAAAPDWLGCNLADRDDLRRAAGRISGRIAALINCAGIFRRTAILAEDAEAVWDAMIAVNLTAPYLLARALAPQLEGGAIVNITSVRAETSAEMASAYTTSKGGLAALTLAFADEWAPRNIRANAIAPGDVDTDMNRSNPGILAKLIERIPQKRMALPEEIAAACVFLASPLAAHVTGATLRIDGGFLSV
jgi:NAD(P)-dependent dehydrogenase (short-subunit alcohol dehydrogenase family)